MAEAFYGYIETTQDVLLIFEGCRRGLIPRVGRRLQEKERKRIRSGSVFVFDERESGIKRWTDGLVWSPSRILGNFLIYRELDKKNLGDKRLSNASASSNDARQRSYSADQTGIMASGMPADRNRERRLVGSLSDSYRFRKDGLIKKTMSIIVDGAAQHLISYYLPNDILSNKLHTPSSAPELASLEISPDFLVKQNFRVPPMVEPPFDHSEAGLTAGINPNHSLSPAGNAYSDDRRIHPFRSMSLGSLRTSNNGQTQGNLSAAGRHDMTNNQQQMMYTSSTLSQRMDIDDNKLNDNNANLSAYYGSQQMHYNTAPSNNGYHPLPSPSSMSSSPNTPMLSPARQSFSQQPRHYSISSNSSGPVPRYSTNRHSFDMMNNANSIQMNNSNRQHQQHNSVNTHMIPEVNIYNNDDQRMKDGMMDNSQNFSSSPNIGQLLNPVHPLNTNGSVIVKAEPNVQNNTNGQHQLFQSMGNSSHYSTDYNHGGSSDNSRGSFDTSKLSNNSSNTTDNSTPDNMNGTYGGNYYIHRQQSQQSLNNAHSTSPVIDNIAPMYRNGMVHPQSTSSSMYDGMQTVTELGMEPLMLK